MHVFVWWDGGEAEGWGEDAVLVEREVLLAEAHTHNPPSTLPYPHLTTPQ